MERPHPPTEKKLRDARKRGDVAKSRLLTSSATVLAVFGWLLASYPPAADPRSFSRSFLTRYLHTERDLDQANMLFSAGQAAIDVVSFMAPCLAVVLLVALTAEVLQMGGITFLGPEAVCRLPSPLKNLKRLFSILPDRESDNTLGLALETGWRLILILFFSGVAAAALITVFLTLQSGGWADELLGEPGAVPMLSLLPLFAAGACGAAAFLLGLAAFLSARIRRRKRLFMSREEVLRELRESEGDPHLSWMRRELRRELARESAIAGARRASVVITGRR